jgi:subtilisin family serine protease
MRNFRPPFANMTARLNFCQTPRVTLAKAATRVMVTLFMNSSRFLVPLCLVGLLAGCNRPPEPPPAAPPTPPPAAPPAPPAPPAKPKITKADDLPRHTYPVDGTVMDILNNDVKFNTLAEAVYTNIKKDLADYDIEDKTTLKRLKSQLLVIDLVQNRNEEARQIINELKDLEDKPSLKLTTGLMALTRLDIEDKLGTKNFSDPAFQKAFQEELTKRAMALPYGVVQDELKSIKAGAELESRNLILGGIQSEIEPTVAKTHSLDDDLAAGVIGARSSLNIFIPLEKPINAAMTTTIKAHNVAKHDIWKERDVTLTKDDKLTPVVIGIWDSGVDPKDYPHKMFVDPASKDDPNGIAFDLHSNQVHGDLYPLGADAKRVPELRSQIKGELDLEANVESPEAATLMAKMKKLPPADVKKFEEDIELFANYIHGTHVAGIASKGNPAAQLLVGRLTFDYHIIPEKPTVEQAHKDVAADQATVDYFKAHNVRVVNMSWGGSLSDVEDALEKNGVGDATERKKEAREIFDIGRDGLLAALKSAPDILFITAAGNSDNDVNFDEVIPSSFDLPNMITVGAVDAAGDETSFTSFGKNVAAYADGFEVESPIPGGTTLKLSGTSMASPEVTNLAAKLFALDSTLKPADVIDLIRQGLEPSKSDPRIQLINPKKSVELLKSKAKNPS